jgi:clan AA aspartic protease (TIGR02281 family)
MAAISFPAAVHAGPDFDAGVASFKKNDMNGALGHFDAAIRRNPNDTNALYYRAYALSRLGRTAEAKRDYAVLIKSYPGTPAGQNAAAAMGYLDPKYLRQLQGISPSASQAGISRSGSTSSAVSAMPSGSPTFGELVQAPAQSKVYFENMGASLLVDAYVNNRPCKMIFDSGAGVCTFGIDKAKELGIYVPPGGPTDVSHGVGGDGSVGTWKSTITLRVGQIEKKNFPVAILENSGLEPLLGQTFYREFNISVDNAAKSISFSKKTQTAGAQPYGSNSAPSGIPFRREGNHIVVKVLIDGRPIDCYLDTGAEVIALSEKHLKEIGLEVPDDATEGISVGVGGQQVDKIFNVRRISCGPIEKTDIPIHVGKTDIPHPLLGQAFFGSLRYEVDSVNNVIIMRY